jgi:hypothetical protein
MTLITQRSAAINKMVLVEFFVLHTTDPLDIAAIEAWVKYHQVDEQLLASLAGLDDGEAWVWSPHYLRKIERFRFRMRETFDSGATPKNLRGKDSSAQQRWQTSISECSASASRRRSSEPDRKTRKSCAVASPRSSAS